MGSGEEIRPGEEERRVSRGEEERRVRGGCSEVARRRGFFRVRVEGGSKKWWREAWARLIAARGFSGSKGRGEERRTVDSPFFVVPVL